ncbi:ABC transporter ATP-binding protein (plasmid) [Microvirga sp. M2]
MSFDLSARETLAIVGESGSGKSLTSLAIMRLLDQALFTVAGDIRLGGKSLAELSEAEMRRVRGNRISMIFQEPMTSLNPVMTIGRQITEVLREHEDLTHAEARRRAEAVLDQVQIPMARQRLGAYPHELSGGMRQRVMIACALACRPEVLIADEPTTALDVTIQREVLDLIRTLQAELRMGVIFVTHDMGVVNEIADRTMVMSAGKVVETGMTDAIFRAPQHIYTQQLIAAVPRMDDVPSTRATPAGAPPLFEVHELLSRFAIRGGMLNRQTAWNVAVDRVSFILGAGETIGVVGESGSGKSTLARAIMGLAPVHGGDIKLEGRSLVDARSRRRPDTAIQMVFQDSGAALNPSFTIGQTLGEAARIGGDTSTWAAGDLLQRVGLPRTMLGRFPHELSGGQRQRVCIARALALRPRIIIADESVAALDVTTKFQIIDMLTALQKESGLSYIFITHDMAVVHRICHKVAVMRRGQLVELGDTPAVLADPRHAYTQHLLSAVLSADPDQRRRRRTIPTEQSNHSSVQGLNANPPPLRYRDIADGRRILAA